MQTNPHHSDPLAVRLGFWSALSVAVTFLVFTVCFVLVYTQAPLPWTNIHDFASSSVQGNVMAKRVAQFSMVLFGPLYVIVLSCIHALVPQSRKLLTRLAIDFGLVFATLSSVHYFVQITTVPWNISRGQLLGLEQFVQSNPSSFILAANMLGWTLFFGISSLCASFAFGRSRLELGLRIALLVNGLTCLAGGVGFLSQNAMLVFLTMNFLMGGAVLAFSILLCLWCRRIISNSRSGAA